MSDSLPELQRLIAEAQVLAGGKHQCAVLGHDWVFVGGSACPCANGGCSLPVHECRSCGDCDYGDNDEAKEILAKCDQEKCN